MLISTFSNLDRITVSKMSFFVCLPPEFLPVSGLLTWICAITLGSALLCSCRVGSWFGACIQTWGWGLCQLGSLFSAARSIQSIQACFGMYQRSNSNSNSNYSTYFWINSLSCRGSNLERKLLSQMTYQCATVTRCKIS